MIRLCRIHALLGLALTAGLALGLVGLPVQAHASVISNVCATLNAAEDLDDDGFTNGEECTGIKLADGTQVLPCTDAQLADPALRNTCLDPRTPDLFVIVKLLQFGSVLATDPGAFDLLFRPQTQTPTGVVNGLACRGLSGCPANRDTFGFHKISPAQAKADGCVRLVSSTLACVATKPQKAVTFVENGETTGTIFGYTNGLYIEDGAQVTVRPKLIQNYLAQIYKDCTTLATATYPVGQDVAFWRHVVAQEIAHVLRPEKLKFQGDATLGPHYPDGSGFVLDRAVVYTCKSRSITSITIGPGFSNADRTYLKLNRDVFP